MKKLLYFLTITILLSCTSQPFTGRIVGKEYTAGHMCHSEDYVEKYEAAVIPVVVARHHHKWENAKFTIWVANRYDLRSYNVDTTSFNKWVMGAKVTMK